MIKSYRSRIDRGDHYRNISIFKKMISTFDIETYLSKQLPVSEELHQQFDVMYDHMVKTIHEVTKIPMAYIDPTLTRK